MSVSGRVPGGADGYVTSTGPGIIQDKDIDGGTATNTRRITIPQANKTVLDALTRKAGTILYATDLQKFYYDNGTVLVEAGSGVGGSFNYIANPDAETNETDSVTSSATTGSWTIARTTTPSELPEPTSKQSAFRIFGSTLTVGDYVEFQAVGTINDADGRYTGRGEVKIKDISGTISGQYKFQAYNKTTSTYIGQSQTVISDGTYKFDVPLTSENNIVIHLIALATSPSNIGVSGVGIFFEPTQTSSISTQWNEETAAITDWDNTTGLTLNTGRLRWKRLEDTMIIKAHYRFSGSGTSGGEFLFNFGSILDNLTIGQDINQFDNSATGFSLNNLAGYPLGVDVRGPVKKVAFYSSGGTVRLGTNMDDSVSGELTYIGFTLILPITEWANSHSLTATEAVYQNSRARFYRSTNQTITDNTATTIIFDQTSYNDGGAISLNTSTGVITFNYPGKYKISSHQRYTATFTALMQGRIKPNNTAADPVTFASYGGNATAQLDLPAEDTFQFEAGDTLEIEAFQNSGVSRDIQGSTQTTFVTVERIPDRSGSSAGFPTTDLADTTKQYLVTDYREADVTLTNSGTSNINGTVKLIRIGKKVTAYFKNITHDSAVNPASAAFVPAGFGVNPGSSDRVSQVITMQSAYVCLAQVSTSDTLALVYRDWAGALSSQTTTSYNFSLTWETDDA